MAAVKVAGAGESVRDVEHPALVPNADGARLSVHLTPKSSRDAIEGLAVQSDGRQVLKVRVRAVPEDGKANAALIEILAKSLRLPRSALALAGGGKSRTKIIAISGDASTIAAAFQACLEA